MEDLEARLEGLATLVDRLSRPAELAQLLVGTLELHGAPATLVAAAQQVAADTLRLLAG